MISLSRLEITGTLDCNTPLCVLLEIVDSCGIIINRDNLVITTLINYLNDFYYPKILNVQDNPYDIAQYINKNTDWTTNALSEAYSFLQQFTLKNDPLQYLPIDFKYGLQTVEHPTSVNACVLYAICKYHSIKTSTDTTIEQMDNAVRLLFLDRQQLLSYLIHLSKDCSKNDLINMIYDKDASKHIDSMNKTFNELKL